MSQRGVEQAGLFGERPRDEAAADPPVARRGKLPLEPLLVAVAAADQPEAAGLAHRPGQATAGDAAHRRQQHRVRDVKLFSKAGAQRHGRVLLQSPATRPSILSDTELFAMPRFWVRCLRRQPAQPAFGNAHPP
jgi:hypothetical protein